MKVMILAAGRGERMRPLTDRVPKALLEAGGKPLIVHLIERLARAGLGDLVVNVSHFAEQIEQRLGDGSRLDVRIAYSREETALETGGGIAYAMPLLGHAPFLVVNSDVYSDFDFRRLGPAAATVERGTLDAHLVLVDNPTHHPKGDFSLRGGHLTSDGPARLTFSGIGVYSPGLFAAVNRGVRCQLIALLAPAMARARVGGEHHRGVWLDVGTPERLGELDRRLRAAKDRR
jgi:N-acetyl-alpha-D-muramate 1-phosphate uridylyltransferase